MAPPVRLIAAVTLPSAPDLWGSVILRVRENCALGVARGEESYGVDTVGP
jgi:hypothetical protein